MKGLHMDQEKKNPPGAPSSDTTSALFVTARKKQLAQQEMERKAKEMEEARLAAEAELRHLEEKVDLRRKRTEEEKKLAMVDPRRARKDAENLPQVDLDSLRQSPADETEIAPPKAQGSKKTILILAAVVVLLAAVAGGALFLTRGGITKQAETSAVPVEEMITQTPQSEDIEMLPLNYNANFDTEIIVQQANLGFSYPSSELGVTEQTDSAVKLTSHDDLSFIYIGVVYRKESNQGKITDDEMKKQLEGVIDSMKKNVGLNVINVKDFTSNTDGQFMGTYTNDAGREQYVFVKFSVWENKADKSNNIVATLLECPNSQSGDYLNLLLKIIKTNFDA
jgi:hypothetical protein